MSIIYIYIKKTVAFVVSLPIDLKPLNFGQNTELLHILAIYPSSSGQHNEPKHRERKKKLNFFFKPFTLLLLLLIRFTCSFELSFFFSLHENDGRKKIIKKIKR
jgi:hypothetical protein